MGDDSDDLKNVISGNDNNGISLKGNTTGAIHVAGNYIGTDITGQTKVSNKQNGTSLSEDIKEKTIGPGNVICGNQLAGVAISGVETQSNQITDNLIGMNSNGVLLGNTGDWVSINGGTFLNRVEKNTIRANGGNRGIERRRLCPQHYL